MRQWGANLSAHKETLQYLINHGNEVYVYCFDTWESQYEEWEKLFELIQPTAIFLAYKQSVEYFSKKYSNVFFLPQSMDKTYFHDYAENKSRLFMQMGRKNEVIHEMILDYLKRHDIENVEKNYVYEREKGKIIYPDTTELAKNISKTKYFVCAPQSLENVNLTGKVSDVTARFYEAMACKTLIIGYKPDTFDELFPYENAMIDLHENNLSDVIAYFDENPKEYWNIVNKNYDFVMKNHTWERRLAEIMRRIGIERY
jgi:glycosyltransferase involved in cell wall biosynthesis